MECRGRKKLEVFSLFWYCLQYHACCQLGSMKVSTQQHTCPIHLLRNVTATAVTEFVQSGGSAQEGIAPVLRTSQNHPWEEEWTHVESYLSLIMTYVSCLKWPVHSLGESLQCWRWPSHSRLQNSYRWYERATLLYCLQSVESCKRTNWVNAFFSWKR